MLSVEVRERGTAWPEEEICEKFKLWYGARPDEKYLKEALNILKEEGYIMESKGTIHVLQNYKL